MDVFCVTVIPTVVLPPRVDVSDVDCVDVRPSLADIVSMLCEPETVEVNVSVAVGVEMSVLVTDSEPVGSPVNDSLLLADVVSSSDSVEEAEMVLEGEADKEAPLRLTVDSVDALILRVPIEAVAVIVVDAEGVSVSVTTNDADADAVGQDTLCDAVASSVVVAVGSVRVRESTSVRVIVSVPSDADASPLSVCVKDVESVEEELSDDDRVAVRSSVNVALGVAVLVSSAVTVSTEEKVAVGVAAVDETLRVTSSVIPLTLSEVDALSDAVTVGVKDTDDDTERDHVSETVLVASSVGDA